MQGAHQMTQHNSEKTNKLEFNLQERGLSP